MGHRKYKGEVSLHNDKGKIRLRWRLNTKRYSLNLSWIYTRTNVITAKKIIQSIEHDITNKMFDTSLEKYKKLKSSLFNNTHTSSLTAAGIPEEASSNKQSYADRFTNITAPGDHSPQKDRVALDIIALFEYWTATYRNMSCDRNIDYNLMKRMLLRWQICSVNEVLIKLQNERFSESTFNRRLSMLKQFFNWLVKKKHIADNPLEDVQQTSEKERSYYTQTFHYREEH